ncbi:MAG: HAD family phosphatase [Pseudomonadota bacterium]
MPHACPSDPVIVFDLGGVLIDWDPRYLYRKLIDHEPTMEWFLDEVCHMEWNVEQDRGRPFAEAVEEAAGRHPDQRELIEAYHHRWQEMVAGAIEDTVAILLELQAAGYELHALTNWSAETFPLARSRFGFLDHFETITVSGEERLIKPDPRIFELMLERISHPAQRCVYIDDSAKNIDAASALGFDAIHFTTPSALRSDLTTRGLLTDNEAT